MLLGAFFTQTAQQRHEKALGRLKAVAEDAAQPDTLRAVANVLHGLAQQSDAAGLPVFEPIVHRGWFAGSEVAIAPYRHQHPLPEAERLNSQRGMHAVRPFFAAAATGDRELLEIEYEGIRRGEYVSRRGADFTGAQAALRLWQNWLKPGQAPGARAA